MRSSLALVAASLASASAWYIPTGAAPPTGLPDTGKPHGPGSHPTGTGTGHPQPTTPLPKTTTVYGPGSTTSTQTIVGTTTYVTTVTKFVPCSTPIATAASSTYYSTYLTSSYATSTITATTTGYVVVKPTGSLSPGSDSHVAVPPGCPPVATVTIYLPTPSAPASDNKEGASSSSSSGGSSSESGSESGFSSGSGSSGSHGGSHGGSHSGSGSNLPPIPGPHGPSPHYPPHNNGTIPHGPPSGTAEPTGPTPEPSATGGYHW